MTDEQIIIGIQSESPNSAIRFLFKQEPKIKAYVLQHKGDQSDADDVFQEALITLCQNIKNETFEQQSSISTYLFGIAKNQWRNTLRKSKPELVEDFEETTIDDEDLDLRDQADRALKRLGEKCQELLKLFYFENFSMESVAQRLGFANPKSAKNQKYKCLAKAKSFLG